MVDPNQVAAEEGEAPTTSALEEPPQDLGPSSSTSVPTGGYVFAFYHFIRLSLFKHFQMKRIFQDCLIYKIKWIICQNSAAGEVFRWLGERINLGPYYNHTEMWTGGKYTFINNTIS